MTTKPKWVRKPTEPGLWACTNRFDDPIPMAWGGYLFYVTAADLSEKRINKSWKWFYGPIPEPPKPKRRKKDA